MLQPLAWAPPLLHTAEPRRLLGIALFLGPWPALRSEAQGWFRPAPSWSLVLRGMCVPAGPPSRRNGCEAVSSFTPLLRSTLGPGSRGGGRDGEKERLSSLWLSFPILTRTERSQSCCESARVEHLAQSACQQPAWPLSVRGFRRGRSCEGVGDDRPLSQV